MLYMIGLGLANAQDISLNGLEAIKQCDHVFLEHYTSVLEAPRTELAELYDKQITVLGRQGVEQEADEILQAAQDGNAAFLVIGDVFGATTHHDLFLRARKIGIEVKVIHNTSIMNAVADTGLDLYRFGRTVTLVYPEGNYRPTSFFAMIEENLERGLHTLCLLDIKNEERRYMSVSEAAQMLLEIAAEQGSDAIGPDALAVGCARMGWSDQRIKTGTLKELAETDLGKPLHTLILPGKMHEIEEEIVKSYS